MTPRKMTLSLVALALGVGAVGRRLADCADSTSWHHGGNVNKGCAWAGQKKWRCSTRSDDQGVLAGDACPTSCDSCPKCVGQCCDSWSWHVAGKRKETCAWVAATKTKLRCFKKSTDDVAATNACPVTCGTCPFVDALAEVRAELAAAENELAVAENELAVAENELAVAENELAAAENELAATNSSLSAAEVARAAAENELAVCQSGLQPSAQPSTELTFPVPSTTAERVTCLQAKGVYTNITDFCGTCCPSCTAVDESTFPQYFRIVRPANGDPVWRAQSGSSGSCLCLDLVDSNYKNPYRGEIHLTDSEDCARIVGDDNHVFGWGGDDAIYSNGVRNELDGGTGDDHLTMDGSSGTLYASYDNDVCTDLGDNSNFDCDDNCFAEGGVPIDCITRGPRFPEKMECLQGRGIYENVTDFCGTCCPACTAVDMDSFKNHFYKVRWTDGDEWRPMIIMGMGDCVCMDLEGSGYRRGTQIAYYPFDGGAATDASVYSSGSFLDGSVYGPTLTTGPGGGDALSFDGVDDSVDFPVALTADILGAAARSVCLWAEIHAFNDGGLFSYGASLDGEDFSLRTLPSPGVLRVQFHGADDRDVTIAEATSGWHHYCVTYDGSAFVLYFDGAVKATGAATLNTGTTYDFRVGVWKDHYLDGALDEVYVFASALDADDVLANYDVDNVKGRISLTPSNDCVRIVGDSNHVYGGDGEDALFASGVGNLLDGGEDDDYVAMDGTGGTLSGGTQRADDDPVEGDACTDLSGANSFSSTCDGNCFDADGDAVACGD